MAFVVVSRGRMRQLLGQGREDIDVQLFGCVVTRAPHSKNDKTYMELDLASCAGDLDLLRRVDAFIRRAAAPAYSPVGPDRVVVKITNAARWETATANPNYPFPIAAGDRLDVVLRPGAFGSFGYCMLVHRLKPHALKPHAA